jgi:hypothetical protein
MKHEDRIHLVHEVPEKGRAKSFCGAVLRKKVWFDTVERAEKQGDIDYPENTTRLAYQKELRSNRLCWYQPARGLGAAVYRDNICPNCKKTEDYALAVLANVP